MIAAPRHWVRSLSLWLSLTVVLTCAIGSFGSPVRASSGSAFNAFTSDVALGPARASDPEKQRKEQYPAAGGAGQAKAMRTVHAALTPPRLAAAPVYVEPSLARPATITAGAVGARAPPHP